VRGAAPVHAQSTQGVLLGRVIDSTTGLGVAGARVECVNNETRQTLSTTTGAFGLYSVPSLSPGTYAVTITENKYQSQQARSVEVRVAARVELNFRLRPLSDLWEAGRSDLFRIPGTTRTLGFYGPDVDSSRLAVFTANAATASPLETSLSYVVDPVTIDDLPLTGRDVYTMLLLLPGVTADTGTARGLGFAVFGQRPSSSDYMLDGADNNFLLATGPLSTPPPEFIQEYRVCTGDYTAEFGRTSGFVANAVTRGATNAWHIGGFFHLENELLNANGFQADALGLPRLPLTQRIVSHYLDGDQIPQIRADFDRCARLFAEAARLQPGVVFDQSRQTFCQGRALIFDRRYADAEQLLRQSIQLDPKHGYAWNALGVSRLEQINGALTAQAATALFDEAAADFRAASRYAPYWAYPVHNLALTLSERGDFDGAIRTYRAAIDIAPQYSCLPYNLGLLYTRLGDLNALGTVALERHDPAAARKLFEQSLADDPQNVSARQNLAVLADAARDYTRADRIWLDLIGDSPDYMAARVALAESLTRRGDMGAAIRQYRGIIGLKPDYAGAHEALARLYFASGDNQAGLAEANAELIRMPSNPFLLELRGDLEIRLGMKTEAQADWKKALTTAPDKAAAGRLRSKLTQARS
jgi:tetratricopeptide (TPR) repeat protein